MALKDTWIPKTDEDYILPRTVNDLASAIIEIEKNGAGVTPTISVNEVANGYEFVVDDGKGNRQNVLITNGKDGEKGESGMPRESSIWSGIFLDSIAPNTVTNVNLFPGNYENQSGIEEILLTLDFGDNNNEVKQWGLNFTTNADGFVFRVRDIGGLTLKWANAEPLFEPGKT